MKLIFLSALILIISLNFITSQELKTYTAYSEKICDKTCNIKYYPTPRFILDGGKWNKIENVKSLINSGYFKININDDGTHKIRVLDFNFTSIRLEFSYNKTNLGIYSNEIKSGKMTTEFKVFGSKQELTKNIQVINEDEKKIIEYNLSPFNKEFHLGNHSTTLTIEELFAPLGDVFALESAPNSVQGGDKLAISSDGTSDTSSYITFNFSTIHPFFISNASINLNRQDLRNYDSGFTYMMYYCNDTFDETTLTWNNQNTEVINCDDSPFVSTTAWNYPDGFNIFEITSKARIERTDDQLFTIKMNMTPMSSGTERAIWWDSKERAGTGEDPFLNITYIPVNITIVTISDDAVYSINQTIIFNITYNSSASLENSSLIINGSLNEVKNITGTENLTIFNKTFELGNYNWTILSCNIENECVYSETRFFNTSKIVFLNESYNNETLEGDTEIFKINVSTGNFQISYANLVYNNTIYTGTITNTGGYNYTLSRTLSVPNVNAEANVTFYWNVILSEGSSHNSTQHNQTINNLAVDDCSGYSTLILNYTIRDEELQNILNGTLQNTSLEVEIDIYSVGATTPSIEYNNNFTKKNPVIICISDDLSNSSYRMYAQAKYSTDDRVVEYHNLQNFSLSNSTIPQFINLYDLATTDSQEFLITFKDSNFLVVPNALINIQRKYVSEGVFKSVEIPKTDSSGKTIGHFVLSDIIYNIIVTKEGQTLATFENIVAFCDNVATGDCTMVLQQSSTTSTAYNFETYKNLNYLVSFNENTRAISVIFNTIDGSSQEVLINATKFDRFGNQSVCSDSLTSSSGTLTCTIPASFGNLSVVAELYIDSELVVVNTYQIQDLKPKEIFAGVQGVLAIVLMMTIPLIFIGSTIMIILGTLVAFIVLILLFVVSGNLIGIASSVIWLIVAGIIIIYKINKQGKG